jgi:hypothetical protein
MVVTLDEESREGVGQATPSGASGTQANDRIADRTRAEVGAGADPTPAILINAAGFHE